MAKNKFKERHMGKSIEKHDTAAWADINELKPISRVPIPSDFQVKNAKEYVDSNQK